MSKNEQSQSQSNQQQQQRQQRQKRRQLRQQKLKQSYLQASKDPPSINSLIYGYECTCLNFFNLKHYKSILYLHETSPQILISKDQYGDVNAFDLKKIQVCRAEEKKDRRLEDLGEGLGRYVVIEDLSEEVCVYFQQHGEREKFRKLIWDIREKMRDIPSESDSELLKNFIKIDKNRNRKLQYYQLITMFEQMKIQSKHEQKNICKFIQAKKQKCIEFKQYQKLSQFFICRKQLLKTFELYSGQKSLLPQDYLQKLMSRGQFKHFLKQFQCESLEQTQAMTSKLFGKADSKISFYDFCYFMHDETNNLLTQEYLNEDMSENFPLTSYYCFSSHNTYLTGDQIKSHSRADRYYEDLCVGVRCVEIDTHDGSNGPLVTHGNTLTSFIAFEEVIMNINNFCRQQPLHTPIIISIQNHCGPENKRKMAQIMYGFFGPKILIIQKYLKQKKQSLFYPTLKQLRGRIIIKSSGTWQKYQKQFMSKEEIQPDYGNLLYLTSMLGTGVDKLGKTSIWESISLSQNVIKENYLAQTDMNFLIKGHVRRSWIRVYPGGSRMNSSNFNPFPSIEMGIQLIALNTQSVNFPTYLAHCFFQKSSKKIQGYRLKPQSDPKPHKKKLLRIRPISAMKIYYNDMSRKKDIPICQVRMRLYCYSDDLAENSLEIFMTQEVRDNAFNPVFGMGKEMVLSMSYESFGYVIVEIAGAGIGVIPLETIKKGYRYVQLYDNKMKKKQSKIFFYIH